MRRILIFIACFSVFFATFGQVSDTGVNTTSTYSVSATTVQNNGFIATGDMLKKLEAKRIELNSKIKIEENRIVHGINERDALQSQMGEIDLLIQKWTELNQVRIDTTENQDQDIFVNQPNITNQIEIEQIIVSKIISFSEKIGYSGIFPGMSFSDLMTKIPTIRESYIKQNDTLTTAIDEAQNRKESIISQYQNELTEVTLEIDRLKHTRNYQILENIKRFSYYLSIFLLLYVAKVVSKKVFTRIERDFSKSHQQAIQMVHRWVFTILFIITFLVLFVSEFVSLLPFIAIIGTGVGLALRDVIYSFIAWFVVGSDSGYQEGEIIETENLLGKVFTISPLLTTVEEYGTQGVTGKLVSFPNKSIFEKNIKNWSRTGGYVMIHFEFLLTYDSDVEKARNILMQIIGARDLAPYYHAKREIEALKNMYGYLEHDLHPQINISHEAR
jgi:hypothetical protein